MGQKQPLTMKKGEGDLLNVVGAKVRFICSAEKTGQAWSLMEVVLPEGSGPPPHHHPWDEGYYVVEGKVSFNVDGSMHEAQAGDFIYAPGGTVHAFKGLSKKPARVLVFDSPAHSEAFFRDCDAEVKELPRDLPKMPEIGARHQVRFVPPS